MKVLCVCVSWRLSVYCLCVWVRVCHDALPGSISCSTTASRSRQHLQWSRKVHVVVCLVYSTEQRVSPVWSGFSFTQQTEFDIYMNVSQYSLQLHFYIKAAVSCIFLLCIHKQISMGKNRNRPPSVSKSISQWCLHQSDWTSITKYAALWSLHCEELIHQDAVTVAMQQ